VLREGTLQERTSEDALETSATGTKILTRGATPVLNRFGQDCLSCHAKAEPQFDLVIAYHVFEHLPRPMDTLRELVAALRPGGYFLVSVPRLDALAVHRDFKYCLHRRNHIVAYTEACLRGLFARADVEVVEALHHLDERFSKGLPLRLRLLARKTAATAVVADPAGALKPVIEAYVALRQQPA
jgi:SAM-dependent methyltransferase